MNPDDIVRLTVNGVWHTTPGKVKRQLQTGTQFTVVKTEGTSVLCRDDSGYRYWIRAAHLERLFQGAMQS